MILYVESVMYLHFPIDNSGELNFMEFVCSMWHFLSMKETDMGYLLFMLHDANGEGTIACKKDFVLFIVRPLLFLFVYF